MSNATLQTQHSVQPRGVEPGPWHLGETATRPLRAAGAVLGDLADLRYDAQWMGLPASAIGAPHPRYRIFILAHRTIPHAASVRRVPRRGEPAAGQGPAPHDRIEPSDHRPRPPRPPGTRARGAGRPGPDRAVLQRWGKYAVPSTLGTDCRQACPSAALLTEEPAHGQLPALWVAGDLPSGWGPIHTMGSPEPTVGSPHYHCRAGNPCPRGLLPL